MNIGIDIVEIGRIKKSIQSPRFLEKCFSEEERRLFAMRNNNPETIAGRFCVKEAFSKALGTGVRGFALNEISTLSDELGAPYIKVTGRAAEVLGDRKTSVSISHTKEYATAVVLIMSNNLP